jgi:hypothetical protein
VDHTGNENKDTTGDEELDFDAPTAREMRDLARLQELWGNQTDPGEMNSDRDDKGPGGKLSTATDTDLTRSNLLSAQSEWRKVLDGSNGQSVGRPILPVTDAIGNESWGDDCHEKAGNIFRSYAQNVNGRPLDRRGAGQFNTLCQAQKEAQADVFL